MAEEKEKWLTFLALTTVLIVVCATLATFKGGGYSTKSILNQSRASDQWAYFEAKGIKSYMYELQRDKLQLDLDLNKKDKLSDKVTDEFQDKIDYYSKNIKRYKAEKDSIQIVAKGFEDARDENKKHSEVFGIAVIFLQVSILLSSISALLKKKYIWLLSLCIAAVGIFYFIDGFLLFYLV
jgi:hypothetical protein